MNKPLSFALALCLSLIAGCGGLQAAPASGHGAGPVGERYTWYDGDEPRHAWLDPRLIAEFPDGAGPDPRAVAPTARALPSPARGVRLWALDDGLAALRSLRSARPEGRYSPVLRDAGGRMLALPGNVVVYLRPELNTQQARNWLSGQGLDVVRRLEFAPSAWLVRAEPGLAALELANRLREAPEVEAAMPEWWQETAPR